MSPRLWCGGRFVREVCHVRPFLFTDPEERDELYELATTALPTVALKVFPAKVYAEWHPPANISSLVVPVL